jgi:hypothetical protein
VCVPPAGSLAGISGAVTGSRLTHNWRPTPAWRFWRRSPLGLVRHRLNGRQSETQRRSLPTLREPDGLSVSTARLFGRSALTYHRPRDSHQQLLREDMTDLVVVFTKDGVSRLRRSLSAFPRDPYSVLVLDDSLERDNQRETRALCERLGVCYHGWAEQKRFLERFDSATSFVARLGAHSWNLGRNRNYAVLHAIASGYERMLMVDDDILFRSSETPCVLLEGTQRYPFVGALITGMPDHSVVGHLCRASGFLLSQYTSATCLALRLDAVNHYFMNIYNEDWIWLCHENEGRRVPQVAVVEQLAYDPFVDLDRRVRFQEPGEVLWEGVRLAYNCRPVGVEATEPAHWTEALCVRRRDLDRLSEAHLPADLASIRSRVLSTLRSLHTRLSPRLFASWMARYRARLPEWRRLLDSLRGVAT